MREGEGVGVCEEESVEHTPHLNVEGKRDVRKEGPTFQLNESSKSNVCEGRILRGDVNSLGEK
jgi:hypothetical protein